MSDEATELIKLSKQIWDMQRYFANISGPRNLEQEQSPAELLAQVATMVDRAIVRVIPVEYAVTTAPLRRAYTYRYGYCGMRPLIV